ncbi:GtrA family protein [Candidatus Omnitrophota bacterium]
MVFVEIFKIYYLTAALVAFLLGAITAYILNVKWVFDKRTFQNRYFEIAIFIVIGVVGLILNQYIIWFFTENVSFHYLLSKLVATMIVVIWNFFARKYILFR